MLSRARNLTGQLALTGALKPRLGPSGDLAATRDAGQAMRWAVLGLTVVAIPIVLLTAGSHLGPGIRYADVLALCVALATFSLGSLIVPWERVDDQWLLVLAGGPTVFTAALSSLTGAGSSPYFALYAPVLAVAGWYLTGKQASVAVALVLGTEVWRATVLDRSGSLDHLAVALPLAVVIAATASLTARSLRNALTEARSQQVRLAAALDHVRAFGRDAGVAVLDQLERALASLFEAEVTVVRLDALKPSDVDLAPVLVTGRTATALVKGAERVHALVRLESRAPFSAQEMRLAAILAEAAGRTIDAHELLQQAQAER
ncbi:MAG TPA: hypothetical protein VMP67_01605 [Candidatus Limnocylindria bacterium]|nr:hypothetical protein [Candidatus Limnocylindria bacterium]